MRGKTADLVSFNEAQKLYSFYSPYLSDKEVREYISEAFGDRFQNISNDPRGIVNHILKNCYPNEAVIKSGFINEVLIKTNDHITIFELNVGSSRADLCKINGTSVAYEIKTDLDSIQRLGKQLDDYSRVFEEVYLICSESKLAYMKENISDMYGIYTYRKTKSGRYIYKKIQNACRSNEISALHQLNIMTKRELSFYFNVNCKDSREEIHSAILNSYNQVDINKVFKQCLKNKYYKEWTFLKSNVEKIHDIDYQWFFKNMFNPELVYQ
jgi:hypothetical protein